MGTATGKKLLHAMQRTAHAMAGQGFVRAHAMAVSGLHGLERLAFYSLLAYYGAREIGQ